MASRKGPRTARPAKAPAAKPPKAAKKTTKSAGPAIVPPAAVASKDQLDDARERAIDASAKMTQAKKSQTSAGLSFAKIVAEVAKVTGFSKAGIKWGLQQHGRPPAEVEAELKEKNRILSWLEVQVGTQFGMFEEGTSPLAKAERAQMDDKDSQTLAAAEAQGFQAGYDGAKLENPFETSSKRAKRYAKGWSDGQAKKVTEMGAGTVKAPTHEPAHA